MKLRNPHPAIVTDADRRRIGVWLAREEGRAWGRQRWLDELELVLEKAKAVDDAHVPGNVVTMNSAVRLADLDADVERDCLLVYPEDRDLAPGAVSVFEPWGIALLGAQVGDVIECPAETCGGRARIEEVTYQPEKAGANH